MNEFDFEIPNFSKYNPRKDVVNTTWFRASNATFHDSKFARLRVHSKLLWFYFLAEFSRNCGRKMNTSVRLIARHCAVRANKVIEAIEELEQNQMLVITRRDANVPHVTDEQTDKQTNERLSITNSKNLKTTKNASSSTQAVKKKKVTKKSKSAKVDSSKQTSLEIQKTPQPIQILMGQYYDLWSSKYGAKIPRKPADGAIIKRLLKVNSFETMQEMLNAYFAMPDAWAVKKAHDLFTFERNFGEITRFINTGKVFTKTSANEADETVHHRQKDLEGEAESMARMRKVREDHERKLKMLETGEVQT